MKEKTLIDKNKLPRHIAIIMDGNGRWARKHGKERTFGHQHGVKPVREVTEAAAELGISYVTLYAFSSENWNRPKEEVDALMQLLVSTISSEVKTMNDNNIRLHAIGDIQALEESCREELMKAIDDTSENTGLLLTLALSYGGRQEILSAVNRIVQGVRSGQVSQESISANDFEAFLYTREIPDPELLIRTSGEQRISNFLLWQLAYAELYFTPVLWPDFSKEDFFKAVYDFQQRERRFGLTSEQLV